ncbi:GATA zinc finger domain-containing protein 14-like isoform X2 [Impatiens glandulifera]|uniref:GATA zinc finger domain-containing protein 14-like isoform X2 n=1 Tax=Impatiens glandulifera TaxID=253017 RepID=UPI001FB16139|nr:GATA zinc finger domain-containing protein 14-like isoform X2 [Impatiens glandulifera]
MEKNTSTNTNHNREPRLGGDHNRNFPRTTVTNSPETRSTSATSSEFVLQWGNRKRLRCMKMQAKDGGGGGDSAVTGHRTTVRIDRRVVRSDANNNNNSNNHHAGVAIANTNNQQHVYLNLRQRPSSPPHRVLRNNNNMETSTAMKGGAQINGDKGSGVGVVVAVTHDKRGGHLINDAGPANENHHHHHRNGNAHGGSGEADGKKGGGGGGGGSSSGSDAMVAPWPPKFVIGLTNKEKEEDFFAFKGSKLPQRPKKRAKFIQRNLNLISPGAWLCELSLERYEVREKKTSKKRPRGLRAMGNMESDSE